ncbi:FAD-containing oxidoreductase [Variovorax soli]|uniref:Pyruvate/2-oxoglutarate dehydrogenase complex dihydrolipoamide dehydrogenase (E3) component n=1 Tax=Variovorax soli TaxID=376815 RepID=A0ABU1NFG5_9BURK|nr:FAD-containing oxidoreductase [Variovorax soli]MDR6537088.1 pyruvate/2-oxoglutarate dehydrogenase complex dihydrolipoamide dehydrogenase (E3) component [Variovorax soli]
MDETFDAIVIGSGQAGPALADRLSQAGWRVAVVERHRFGGTCVNTGCIPTKAMVASAHVAALLHRSQDFGISIRGEAEVDFPAVMARKSRISGSSSEGVEKWLRGMPGITVIQGHARFEAPGVLRVGERLLHSERVFINVGGRASELAPDIRGGVDVLNNSSLMALDRLPEHLGVVGGSYVGLEFAQMFRRYGSRVTVLQRGAQIVPREDADVARALQETLEREGVEIRTGTECFALRREGAHIAARWRCGDDQDEFLCTHVLNATGRRPNTDDLGLDRCGVEVDERGFIRVDDQLRTSAAGIWALGDCNGRGAFTHTAYNDFEIVAANLLDADPRRVSDRIPAYALYTDPPLARIGITVGEALASGRPTLIGERPMSRVGRAVQKGEEQGFLRVLVDAQTRHLVGATLLGVEADEAVHALLTLMYARQPVATVQRGVFIHPTVSELLPTVLGALRPLEAATAQH